MERFCNDCEYFCPSDGLRDVNDMTGNEEDEGECRKNPPAVGDMVKFKNGEEERWYGNFPRVCTSDWCGEFSPCARAISDRFISSRKKASDAIETQCTDKVSPSKEYGKTC